jgi:glutaredoxin-related protein
MQDVLASMTSRKTVPNIMVNMQSIGGASEVVAMSHEGTLIDKIKKLGGSKIISIKQLEEAD